MPLKHKYEAAFFPTPQYPEVRGTNVYISTEIIELIRNKRIYIKLVIKLVEIKLTKLIEYKNDSVKAYLKSLVVSETDEYSLWRATKCLKRPSSRNIPIKGSNGEWCRSHKSKGNTFKEYLEETFIPFNEFTSSQQDEINYFLDIHCQMERPIKSLNNTKSSIYNLINPKIIKLLPKEGVIFLTTIFNAV